MSVKFCDIWTYVIKLRCSLPPAKVGSFPQKKAKPPIILIR